VRVFLSVAGQVEVDRRRLERLVTEVLLDEAQVDAGFEEMRRVAVAEGVDRDAFFEAELGDDTAQRALDCGLGQRLRRRVSLGPSTAEGGEEEAWVAVGRPVAAEGVERACGKWDVAIDGAFAAVDMNEGACGVDVADLEGETFGEAQAERVDRPEAGTAVFAASGRDDATDLFDGEDVGELRLRRHTQVLERLPVAWHGAAE
jgi:hypothetical protein